MTTREKFAHYLAQATSVEIDHPYIEFGLSGKWVMFDWHWHNIEYAWALECEPMDKGFTFEEAVKLVEESKPNGESE